MKQKTRSTNGIYFFKEGVRFRLINTSWLKHNLVKLFQRHHLRIHHLNYIFCSDRYLRKLNKQFLNHDYFTDILTFDNSTQKNIIEADIFVSIHRVLSNAKKYNSSFNNELHRVMIHGALHLVGYKDKTAKDKNLMREAEDYWLETE